MITYLIWSLLQKKWADLDSSDEVDKFLYIVLGLGQRSRTFSTKPYLKQYLNIKQAYPFKYGWY